MSAGKKFSKNSFRYNVAILMVLFIVLGWRIIFDCCSAKFTIFFRLWDAIQAIPVEIVRFSNAGAVSNLGSVSATLGELLDYELSSGGQD